MSKGRNKPGGQNFGVDGIVYKRNGITLEKRAEIIKSAQSRAHTIEALRTFHYALYSCDSGISKTTTERDGIIRGFAHCPVWSV